MQRQTVNALAGCAAAIEELRMQVAPDAESKVMPQLHKVLTRLRTIAGGGVPPDMMTRQQRRAAERDAKK